MGNRLSKITTRTGDAGQTGLGNGTRLPKDHARIAVIGDVDELNSTLGLLHSETLPQDMHAALERVQNDLFDLGGELSTPGYRLLEDAQVQRLETWIDEWNAGLPPLAEFILPGGSRAAALAHVARTVCRRAERSLVHLADREQVAAAPRVYLNRLSDLLFIWGRVLNGGQDRMWQRPR